MDFVYSKHNAGSWGFNPPDGIITHGQYNQGRTINVILLAFSNQQVMAG